MFRIRRTTIRASIARALLALAAGASLQLHAPAPAAAQEVRPVRISVDRAKVVRIPRAADTVVIGNPGIVDATLQDATTIIITGRAAGETNIIVLDEAGDPIVDETIVVGPPLHATVRLFSGTVQRSYACAPTCAPVVDAGDEPVWVENRAKAVQNKIEASKVED